MECLSCGTPLRSMEHPCDHCQAKPLQQYICQNPLCRHTQLCSPQCTQCDRMLAGPLSGKSLDSGESTYYIRELLGGGGMGEVYRGIEENRSGEYFREVAIKLNKEITTPERQDRFRREVQNLIKLNNPHNVRVYGYGEQRENGVLIAQFMAMELLRGTTLEQLLTTKPLAIMEALTIYRQIARALSEAHQKGVIHRDLKPDNIILINPPEDPPFAKLFDFGLSKVTAKTNEPKISSSGMIVGTLSYMSPEQARGEEVDQRSDIFSLGVILYEVLTQKLPFPAQNLYQLYQIHPQGPPELPEELPSALNDLIQQSLAYDPVDRFSHLYECLALLPSIDPTQMSEFFTSGEWSLQPKGTHTQTKSQELTYGSLTLDHNQTPSTPKTTPPLPFSKQFLWALTLLITISGGFAFFFLWKAQNPEAKNRLPQQILQKTTRKLTRTATANQTKTKQKPTAPRPTAPRPTDPRPTAPRPTAPRPLPPKQREPSTLRLRVTGRKRSKVQKKRMERVVRQQRKQVRLDFEPRCTRLYLWSKTKRVLVEQTLRLVPGTYRLQCINQSKRFRRTLKIRVNSTSRVQEIVRRWKRIKVKILFPKWALPSADGFPLLPIRSRACQIGCFTYLWEGANRLVLRRPVQGTSRRHIVHRRTLRLDAHLANQPIAKRTFVIRWK